MDFDGLTQSACQGYPVEAEDPTATRSQMPNLSSAMSMIIESYFWTAHQRHLNPRTPFSCALCRRNAANIGQSGKEIDVFSKA